MLKIVNLALNDFPTVPESLCRSHGGGVASSIEVNLADLYHHYYIDSWGVKPPDPNPVHFEQIRQLLPCAEFRFSKTGLGIGKTFKGNKSNELGQAFCRWFLSRHLAIDYIAHLEHVKDHGALQRYGGLSIVTNPDLDGDAPDYFCASGSNQPYLARISHRCGVHRG